MIFLRKRKGFLKKAGKKDMQKRGCFGQKSWGQSVGN